MKLYTEEQVRQSLMKHQNSAMLLSIEQIDYLIEEITPIELPSDEEIEEYADSVMPYAEKIGGETYTAYRAIKLGAKWVCKIIQGRSHE